MASIIDRIKGLVNKNAQSTHELFNRAIYNYLGDSLIWNPTNNDTFINQGYRHNSTVYSIINLITKTATTVPFQVYEIQSENELKRYKAMTSGKFDATTMHKSQLLMKKALVELEGTELHELLDRPNPAQSYNTFISELIAFGKLTGNRYIYGIGPETNDDSARFNELYVLPSQAMQINSDGLMNPIDFYTLDYNGTVQIPADKICHIKDVNLYYDGTGSHLYGMSPLEAGLRSMQMNNEALTTGVKYLQNQTARGVLMSDEGDLNEIQARQLKEKFKQQYQGSKNAGDVVITPKKLSWINFGLNASDLSLIEQYNASIKDLCNVYHVPAVLLNNVESATYNNIKEARKMLYTNAIIPELVKLRDELNRWLTPRYGDNLYIDFDFTVIPELQEEMDKVVDQMSAAWWLTPNEKRAAMSYGQDEENTEMDKYFVPVALMPMGGPDMDFPPIPEEELNKSMVPGMNDVFTTIREAQERAIQMGGEGYHPHIFNGNTVYMPFASHEEYEAAKENRLDEYYAEIENDSHHYEIQTKKVSERVRRALQDKVDEHNEEHGDDPDKRTTLGALMEVFRRGVGAYQTNPSSVRPGISGPDQWAYARVNNFLRVLRTGRFRSGEHDTDLLPEGHPQSSKKNETKQQTFDDYPQSATNNAKRMLDWIEEYGRDVVQGGTKIGLARANQISRRDPLSLETLRRTFSFLSRHKENAKIEPEFQKEPWKDRGYVAYNLWGGAPMLRYAERELSKIDD